MTSADPPSRKPLRIAALLFAAAGVALIWAAWTGSPQLRVPAPLAFVLAGVLFVVAVMAGFPGLALSRWNDLMAATVLLGVTVETLWLAFGSGPPRTCHWGWWSLPERVCRGGYGLTSLILGGLTLWAVQRFRTRGHPR